jgi:hypothetical protein
VSRADARLLRRKLRTALAMAAADKQLVAEASAALLAARLCSGLLPFRVLSRQLGGAVAPTIALPVADLSEEEQATVRAVRWAVGAAAPWLPFRTLCLQQAIAARAMLARRGIGTVLRLGVTDAIGAKLIAHAWLDAGALKVTGYPFDSAFVEVARFVSNPNRPDNRRR